MTRFRITRRTISWRFPRSFVFSSGLTWVSLIALCPLHTLFSQVVVDPPKTSIPLYQNDPFHYRTPSPPTLPQIQQQYAGSPMQPQVPLSEQLGDAFLMPPRTVERLFPLWPFYAAASLVGLLIALYLIWRHFKNLKKNKPVPRIPSDIQALEALESLLPLVREAKAREFSFLASEIIRTYIESRFGIRTLNKTTREFLQSASEWKGLIPDQETQALDSFLNYCDQAKFARHRFTREEMESLYQSARNFVKHTRPAIMACGVENAEPLAKEVA